MSAAPQTRSSWDKFVANHRWLLVGGAVFMHGGGADTLRQEVRIEITPGAAGGLFGFHFPVDSATAPVPEPSMVVSVFLGLAAIAAWRSRKTN